MDLVDDVRVILGAFLCPRVGLFTVDEGRYPYIDIVSNTPGNQRNEIAHRWLRNDLDLTRAKEHAMLWFAGEILDILNGSVVFTDGVAQFDTNPFTGSE